MSAVLVGYKTGFTVLEMSMLAFWVRLYGVTTKNNNIEVFTNVET